MDKLISVIVPVYNVESYLEQCVNSIRSQTYKNLEILLVDDGSKDGSATICDEFAKKDERIRVIHKENGGVSSARNIGLDHARGEYIAFVDGDDYIDDTMYEKLAEKMTEGIDIVFGYYQCEYPDGTIDCYTDTYDNLLDKPWDIRPMLCSGERVLNGEQIAFINCGCWRSLYRKEIIDTLHLRFDHILKMGEDRIFLVEYLNECNRAGLIKEPLYHYRKERQGSACTSNALKIGLDYEHEKRKWQLKKQAIENNSKLSFKAKQTMVLFLGHEYYMSFVSSQTRNNKRYKEELKKFNNDIEVKQIRKTLTIKLLRDTGYAWKSIFMMKLMKWRMYRLYKLLRWLRG